MLAAVLAVVFGCGLSVTRLDAQSNDPISTKYIASDAFLIISVSPSGIADCADKKSETTDYVLKSIKKFTSIDVKKMDQVIVQMGAGDDKSEVEDVEDGLGIVMRFSEKIDVEEMVGKIGQNFELEKTELDGKIYYEPQGEGNPGLFFPDDKTMIMAEPDRIKILKDAGGGMSNVNQLAKKLTTADHLGIVIDLGDKDSREKRQEMLDEMLSGMDFDELGIDEDIINELDSAVIRVNLNSDTPVNVTVNCKDATTAGKIVEGSKKVIETMKEKLEEAEEELANAPAEMAETAEKILELANDALENTKVTSSGSTVNVKIEKKGGMTAVVDAVAKGLEQTFKMLESFGGGF
jgi:prefoldin subunit 5